MKRTFKMVILCLVMIAMLAVSLSAQTLPVDSRKKEMQFHRGFEALRYTTPADTLWHRITIPARAVEISILAETGVISVSPDSLYTKNKYVNVPVGTPMKLPVMKADKLFVRRAAAATGSIANIIIYKM